MPMNCSEAVGAGVTATNNDDLLASRREALPKRLIACINAILLRQEIHGEVNALKLTSGRRQIAWNSRAACKADGVEPRAQLFRGQIHAHIHAGLEDDSL